MTRTIIVLALGGWAFGLESDSGSRMASAAERNASPPASSPADSTRMAQILRGKQQRRLRTEGKVSKFGAEKLAAMREKVAALDQSSNEAPDGWSKSPFDPAEIVAVFEPLKVRKGVVLRAYQFKEGGNGNGVVWALPEAESFPEPDRCRKVEGVAGLHRAVPRPAGAFASVRGQIEGDGSPWSYLAASILGREIEEFGAVWHGAKWSTHRILDDNPLKSLGRDAPEDGDPMFTVRGKRSDWKWLEDEPDDWRPQVAVAGDRVTVTFYTFSGLERQTIYRHRDTFTAGSYDYQPETKPIAQGPGGFLF